MREATFDAVFLPKRPSPRKTKKGNAETLPLIIRKPTEQENYL
jgi:hypothetical protein